MKPKIIPSLLVICMILSVSPTPVQAYEHPSEMWSYYDIFYEAVKIKDYDTIISLADTIMSFYDGESLNKDNSGIMSGICENTGKAYYAKGNLDKAVEWLRRCQIYNQCIYDTIGDYRDKIKLINGLIRQIDIGEEIYVETTSTTDIPYYGVLGEPTQGILVGSTNGGSINSDESAMTHYLEFGQDSISSVGDNPKVQTMIREGGIVQVAWNFPNEADDVSAINSGKWDDYISESIEYLSSLGTIVYLRIGAEMNAWTKMSEPSEYNSAFQRIATVAHTADNIATVLTMCCESHWDYEFDDFYPGDKYVDWIGISVYWNIEEPSATDDGDAYYSFGRYSNNPVSKIRALIEAFPNKPYLISGCGFATKENTTNEDLTAISQDKMKKFYTYTTMVYPQIKGIFYFDASPTSGKFSYTLSWSETLLETYKSLTSSSNYLNSTSDTATSYTKLSSLNEQTDTLKLYTYALYPTYENPTCEYYLDGSYVNTVSGSSLPLTLSVSDLSTGWHTIKASITCDIYSKTVVRMFYVSEDGTVSGASTNAEDKFTDISQDKWYYEAVQYCYNTGLFTGTSDNTFEPDSNITRAMFVTVIGRMAEASGENITGYSSSFSDTESNSWYSDYLAWGYSKGIINGYSKTSFGPNDNVTREQIAALLNRFAQYMNISLSLGDSITFTDSSSVSAWAASNVAWAGRAGLITGYEDGSFRPLQSSSRAEVAAILMRLSRLRDTVYIPLT